MSRVCFSVAVLSLPSLHQAASYLDQYTGLASSTFACGIMAVAIRVLLVAVGAMVVANFNKGLKEQGEYFSVLLWCSRDATDLVTAVAVCRLRALLAN